MKTNKNIQNLAFNDQSVDNQLVSLLIATNYNFNAIELITLSIKEEQNFNKIIKSKKNVLKLDSLIIGIVVISTFILITL